MSEGTRVIRQEEAINNGSEIKPDETIFEKTTIYSSELEEIFDEWVLSGKGDLVVEPDLCDKLQNYISYLEKLNPLKQKFAEVSLEKYIVSKSEIDGENKESFWVYINENRITYAGIYFSSKSSSTRSFIKALDFKYLSASVGNTIWSYAYKDSDEVFVDLRLWVLDLGGKIVINEHNGDKYYNITIPVKT